jgi:hypothetical protein
VIDVLLHMETTVGNPVVTSKKCIIGYIYNPVK